METPSWATEDADLDRAGVARVCDYLPQLRDALAPGSYRAVSHVARATRPTVEVDDLPERFAYVLGVGQQP